MGKKDRNGFRERVPFADDVAKPVRKTPDHRTERVVWHHKCQQLLRGNLTAEELEKMEDEDADTR